MRLRRFRPEDQRRVREICEAGLAERFDVFDGGANPDLVDIQRSYLDAGHEFLVAEEDEGVIAACGCLLPEAEPARVVRLSVDRAHRRRGIGRALVHECRELVSRAGRRELLVYTEPHWQDALTLYESLGFRRFGRDEVDLHLRLRW